MERVAHLFVTKTVYAMLLALLVGALTVPFPFLPRHLTIVSTLTIGVPGFFLALAPNRQRFRGGFLRRVLIFATPTGVVAAAATYAAYGAARAEGVTLEEARTSATLVLIVVGLSVLALLARPFTFPLVSLEVAMAAAFALVLAVPGLRTFFALYLPPPETVATSAGVALGAVLVLEVRRRLVARHGHHRDSASGG